MKMPLNTVLLIAIIALFGLSSCDIDETALPLIGVIAQPASNHLNNQFFSAQSYWNYVPKSYLDWIRQTGAMPVIIAFDLPQNTLNHLLNSVQGILFPGGGSALFDAHGSPTIFQQRTKYILDFAAQKNDQGIYYPVIGTCFGFQAVVNAIAGNKQNLLTCSFGDEETSHPVTPTDDFVHSVLYNKMMDQTLVSGAFSTGNLYYSHNCGFSVSTLKNNAVFSENAYILGTSVSLTGKTFVSNIEHKKYPFYGHQWHPEKTQFERLGIDWLKRDSTTRQFVSSLINTIVDATRPHAVNIDSIDGEVRAYFEIYYIPERPGWDYFEQIYMLRQTGHIASTSEEVESDRKYENAEDQSLVREARDKLEKQMLEFRHN